MKTYRLVVTVAILASFVAFLDGAVVNVALPVIQTELGGGLAAQQWVVDGYLLTLGAFILVAGSLSDLFGRSRILRYGLIGFGASSLLCAIAPNMTILVLGRLLQGVAGALLVPSSLALINDEIPKEKFGKAIGQWTAWTGISYLIGPLLGGFFVDQLSWRYIFAINIVPILMTLWLMRKLQADRHNAAHTHVDFKGVTACVVGLGGLVFAFIEQARLGWSSPLLLGCLVIGLVSLGYFMWHEQRTAHPMLSFTLFRNHNFSVGNLATLAVYGGLGIITFILVLFLQQTAGYSATLSGLSLVPITLIMFSCSAYFGSLAQRFGPRLFMGLGPVTISIGLVWLAIAASTHPHYLTDILPGVLLFGIGLAATVAPLTAAILSDVPKQEAGIASAVNNAIARIAGLLAIALIGAVMSTQFSASLTRADTSQLGAAARTSLELASEKVLEKHIPQEIPHSEQQILSTAIDAANIASFRTATLVTAAFVAIGGVISLVGIRNPKTNS